MSKKTVDAYKPGKHSEEAELLHEELRLAIMPMADRIEQSATKKDLLEVAALIQSDKAELKKDLLEVAASVQSDKAELKKEVADMASFIQEQLGNGKIEETNQALSTLSEQISALAARVAALES